MNLRVLALGLVAATSLGASAQEGAGNGFGLESVGVRYGFGEGNLSRDFEQAEATVDMHLPYKLNLGKSWQIKPRAEFSLGGFGNDHATAVIGSVGAIFSLAPSTSPLVLEVGVGAAGLSEEDFETRRIGGLFQIRSLFGLSWTINQQVRVGYHFQHMSNGGLATNNQGVNMHTISVAYCF